MNKFFIILAFVFGQKAVWAQVFNSQIDVLLLQSNGYLWQTSQSIRNKLNA